MTSRLARCAAWRENSHARKLASARRKTRARQVRPRRSYWDQHSELFDVDRFVIARIKRTTFKDFQSRVEALPVHNIDGVTIPLAVRAFLGKSPQLVPTKKIPSWRKIGEDFDSFVTVLHRKIAIAGFPQRDKPDVLAGIRRKFYKPTSTRQPDQNCLPEKFQSYVQKIRGDIFNAFYRAKEDAKRKRS